jgi:hypothetical protein
MGLFTKKIGPVFLKEASDTTEFIEKMQKLKMDAAGDLKKNIEKQINLAKYGEMGEKNVAYELKSSGMDMYILHDIYLETDTLSAQIDYLVVTRKRVYVIECKNLIGNIEIDNTGNFIRTYELFGKKLKEGIYSPITQNQRHLQVLKDIRGESRGNRISRMMFENGFEENYKSVVVLANPKTYLNAKYAKKEVKEQVVRADQLIAYFKKMDELAKGSLSEKEMLEIAQFFLEKNKPERSDYARKYEEMLASVGQTGNVEKNTEKEMEISEEQEKPAQNEAVPKDNAKDDVRTRLKAFRLERSRSEGLKPYFIFNDAQMEELIVKNPKTKEELMSISGFGQVKAEKYGEEILKILAI